MSKKVVDRSIQPIEQDIFGAQVDPTSRTFLDSATAAFESNALQSGLAGLGQAMDLAELEERAEQKGDQLLQPGELNQMFPGLPKPFIEPTYRGVAQRMAFSQEHELSLQKRISEGPQGGLYSAGYFTAGLLAHAVDPVNLGVSILTSGVFGAALNGTRVGTAMGVGAANSTLSQGFLRASTEGIIGNVIAEPFSMISSEAAGVDQSIEQIAINTVGGAVGFAGLTLGVKAGAKQIGKLSEKVKARWAAPDSVHDMIRHSPEMHTKVHAMATSQMAEGKKIDVEAIYDAVHAETNFRLDTDAPFSALAPDEVRGATFFSASRKPRAIKFDKAPNEVMGTYFGRGGYFSDSKTKVNGAATRGNNPVDGTIFEHRIINEKINVLETRMPYPDAAKDIVKSFAKENGLKVNTKFSIGQVIKQILDEAQIKGLDTNIIDDLNLRLDDAGFHGYIHDGSMLSGRPHDPHNAMLLFRPENHVETVKRSKGNRAITPKPTDDDVRALFEKGRSIESDMDFDAKRREEVKSVDKSKIVEKNRTALVKDREADFEDMKTLDDLGMLDAKDKDLLLQIEESIKNDKIEEEALRDADICLGGGVGDV